MLRDSHHNATYVTITTESGLVGLGEAYAAGPDLAVAETVRYLGEWLVGRTPRGASGSGSCVPRAALSGGRGGLGRYQRRRSGAGDLAGKIADQPVYQLLGGAYRDRIWLYHDVVTGRARGDGGGSQGHDRRPWIHGIQALSLRG